MRLPLLLNPSHEGALHERRHLAELTRTIPFDENGAFNGVLKNETGALASARPVSHANSLYFGAVALEFAGMRDARSAANVAPGSLPGK